MQESSWHKFGQNPLSGYWDIVIFTFCAFFSNGQWRPSCQIAKNSKRLHSRNFWHKFESISTIISYDILIFVLVLFFSNSPKQPSWMLNLHKYEIVPLKKSKRPHARKILAQSWINFIQWFLRYCHLRVYANFSNDPWRPSWIVNLHNYEMVLFRDNCDRILPKYIYVFLRYWHLSEIGLVTTK